MKKPDRRKHFIMFWPIEGKEGKIKVGSYVSELLTNGRYEIVQIDTLNDIDLNTQKLARRFLCTGYELIKDGDIVHHLPDPLPSLTFKVVEVGDPDYVTLIYHTHPERPHLVGKTRESNPRQAMFKLEYEITLTPECEEWVPDFHWVQLQVDTDGTKQRLSIKCPTCKQFHNF